MYNGLEFQIQLGTWQFLDFQTMSSPVKMCWQAAILLPTVAYLPLTPLWTSLKALQQARRPGICCLLLQPAYLPTAAKHFDRAEWETKRKMLLNCFLKRFFPAFASASHIPSLFVLVILKSTTCCMYSLTLLNNLLPLASSGEWVYISYSPHEGFRLGKRSCSTSLGKFQS